MNDDVNTRDFLIYDDIMHTSFRELNRVRVVIDQA
jgi:hypothetical protein